MVLTTNFLRRIYVEAIPMPLVSIMGHRPSLHPHKTYQAKAGLRRAPGDSIAFTPDCTLPHLLRSDLNGQSDHGLSLS